MQTDEEILKQFAKQKEHPRHWFISSWLFWYLPILLAPGARWAMFLSLGGLLLWIAGSFGVYYLSRRCPKCRRANLFLGPTRETCRDCGVVLQKAEDAKTFWRMIWVLPAAYGAVFICILAYALQDSPGWLIGMIVPIILLLFIGGPFLLHRLRDKLI